MLEIAVEVGESVVDQPEGDGLPAQQAIVNSLPPVRENRAQSVRLGEVFERQLLSNLAGQVMTPARQFVRASALVASYSLVNMQPSASQRHEAGSCRPAAGWIAQVGGCRRLVGNYRLAYTLRLKIAIGLSIITK